MPQFATCRERFVRRRYPEASPMLSKLPARPAWTAGPAKAACSSLLCCSKLQDGVAPSASASKAKVSRAAVVVLAAVEPAAAPAAAAEWPAELAAFVPASAQAAA